MKEFYQKCISDSKLIILIFRKSNMFQMNVNLFESFAYFKAICARIHKKLRERERRELAIQIGYSPFQALKTVCFFGLFRISMANNAL